MKKNSKNDNSDIEASLNKLDELMNTRSLNELEYTKENAFKILSRKDLMNTSKKVQRDYRRSPLVDKVFKIIFENSSNKRFTALLISCVTGLNYDYILENMEFYKNDINNDSIEERQMHGDLMINLKGTFIGIEMNNYNRIDNYK